MGRGLGARQREVLSKLDSREWTPLHELADDPDNPNEMAKARSAAHGLERRGLVHTCRDTDPNRLVHTTVITAEVTAGFNMVYVPEPSAREWHGMFVKPRDPQQETSMGEWASLAVKELEDL